MLGASAVAALTMPLLIRNKLAHKIAGPNTAKLQFDFSDFKVFLTGEPTLRCSSLSLVA